VSRRSLRWAFGVAFLAAPGVSSAEPVPRATTTLVLVADADDDDDDGVRDTDSLRLSGSAATDVTWFSEPGAPLRTGDPSIFRIVPGSFRAGRVFPPGKPGQFGVHPLAAGSSELVFAHRSIVVRVLEVLALDGYGERVDLVRSHAAISRKLPSFLASEVAAETVDPDSLRWVIVGPPVALPDTVALASRRPDGAELDRLSSLSLADFPCPRGVDPGLACRATDLVRATGDRIDRVHPESSSRSLRAEVGGRIALSIAGRKAASIRVGGPRRTAFGPIERYRARMRMHVLRSTTSGMPAVGGDDAGALSLARAEIDAASGLWGQCGVHFGEPREAEVFVRDPPPPHLLAVGCALGLPATGGEIRFRVGGRALRIPTRAGATPTEVAVDIVQALQSVGLGAGVSPNPDTGVSALPTADVLVRLPDGALARIEPDGNAPVSSDPTLAVCLGEVDLADGLTHFSDSDAHAGTIEERALIKAYADGDPTTVDVFVVPAFSGAGRIGESFVDMEGASIQNVVVLDRAGVRAGARSFALAHELGHVLLDMAGHPDDYGVDSPSALMDADATDPSIFGPRRLSVAECERAVRQSGETARIPLLTPWPMTKR
jgi:hypothetical protein